MTYFYDLIIKSYILESGYHRLCEIGASVGNNTLKLLENDALVIDIIDPCIDANLSEQYRDNKRVHIHKGISLDVLPIMSLQFDCILIDGDHNWYTVYNELTIIEERNLIRLGGTIFVHDVGWPYGRRDMYYQPERIPAGFKHPYMQEGVARGQSELNVYGMNATAFNAVYEGGTRNGVLKAIQDFLKERKGKYKFFFFGEEHGLGVLLKTRRTFGTTTYNKYLLLAKCRSYRLLAPKLKAFVRHKLQALYLFLKTLRRQISLNVEEKHSANKHQTY